MRKWAQASGTEGLGMKVVRVTRDARGEGVEGPLAEGAEDAARRARTLRYQKASVGELPDTTGWA